LDGKRLAREEAEGLKKVPIVVERGGGRLRGKPTRISDKTSSGERILKGDANGGAI